MAQVEMEAESSQELLEVPAASSYAGRPSLGGLAWRAAAAAAALLGCVAIATNTFAFSGAPAGSSDQVVSVRSLLESPALADTVSNAVMSGGRKAPAERDAVHAKVVAHVLKIGSALREQSPALDAQLDELKLTAPERDSLLRSMRLLGDSRLHDIGAAVGEAWRQTAAAPLSEDPSSLNARVERELQPHSAQLRLLLAEILPPSMRAHARGADAQAPRADRMPVLKRLVALRRRSQEASSRSLVTLSGSNGPIAEHFDVFFDLINARFDSSFALGDAEAPSRRLGEAVDFSYNVCSDNAHTNNQYTVACQGAYSNGMQCNPECRGYDSMMSCLMGEGVSTSIIDCVTEGPAVAMEAIKSLLGFEEDGTTPAPLAFSKSNAPSAPQMQDQLSRMNSNLQSMQQSMQQGMQYTTAAPAPAPAWGAPVPPPATTPPLAPQWEFR
eukprot:TRINITY_DN54954_c0_g1_i1.p2 TRINITY_DN54954_c0_g1~~TRINITY_DN54954_c0_g1_i1.p2  ORF type:complete len:442 (-),score=107.84 TRINITY_DN54954_c0_g1_i1:73-1398(-)